MTASRPVAAYWRVSGVAALSALAVLALGTFAVQRLRVLNEGTDFAATTQRGRYELAQVLQSMMDMGSGVRRFEATGELTSFNEAHAAAAALPGELGTLKALLADDPEQREALATLGNIARRRTQLAQRLFDRAEAGDHAQVRAMIAEGEGARITEASRALIARMQDRQGERLTQRMIVQTKARDIVAFSILACSVLAAALILLVTFIALRLTQRQRRTQDELETTLSSIGDAVISTDANGAIRFMNRVAEQLTGWSSLNARGLALNDVFRLIDESTRERVDNPVARVLRQRRTIGLANHTVLIDREGRERSIEDSAAPIRGTDQGIQGVVLVFRDVTAQRAAQQALLASEAALREANASLEQRIADRSSELLAREALIRAFFQHSSECHAILVELVGGEFRYAEINPAALKLFGKSREQVIGRTLTEVFDAATATLLNGHLGHSLRINAPYRYERTLEDCAIEATATPVPQAAGMGRAVLVTARDVTERQRWQAQLLQAQKMEAVARLTGGVAHDFNNLLMVITGGLGLIDRLPEPQRRQRILDGMRKAAERGAALSRQLLAFSRRQPLKPEPVDLARQIDGMHALLDRTLRGDVHVKTALAEDLWPVKVDPAEFELVVLNLCVNARDAMPDGGLITLGAHNVAHVRQGDLSGDFVCFTVADQGIGMSSEVLARVFEPFFTTKEIGQGSGLGLPQVYGFARQSGGSVRVDSSVGHGTTVVLMLPRSAEVPVPAAPRAELDTTARHRSLSRSILLVEDDDEVAALVAEMLRELGHRVTRAASAQAALGALADNRNVDLVFSDIMMPGAMDGVDLAKEISTSYAGIPVLLTSGYAGESLRKAAALNLKVLRKPYMIDTLDRALRAAFAA